MADTTTEKTRLLAMETPRPSLSSIYARPDATCSQDVPIGKAFRNIFKKKKNTKDTEEQIRDVVVDITKKDTTPDLTIKTEAIPFKGHITIEGVVSRVATVVIQSSLSNISCHFPKHAPGQTVHMVAATVHGTVKVGLPCDYDGFIVLETMMGHRSRRDMLENHCSLSSPRDTSYVTTTYRVRPEQKNKGKGDDKKVDTEEYDPSKHDYCRLRSYIGHVKIGYIEEMGIFKEDCLKEYSTSKGCTVS